MNYNFPKTKFAEQNTIGQQIEHVLSEVEEVFLALLEESNERGDEELADLTHSLETLWRIIAAERGEEYVQQLFEQVIVKNAERNYYVPESVPVAVFGCCSQCGVALTVQEIFFYGHSCNACESKNVEELNHSA